MTLRPFSSNSVGEPMSQNLPCLSPSSTLTVPDSTRVENMRGRRLGGSSGFENLEVATDLASQEVVDLPMPRNCGGFADGAVDEQGMVGALT